MRWLSRRHQNLEPSALWREAWSSTAAMWSHLSEPESDRLWQQAWQLTRRCRWEGLDGLEVTTSLQGVITAEGCLLSVNLGSEVFRDVTSILIAPTSQNRMTRHRTVGPVVSESRARVLGESLLHGPVRLAWDRIVADRSRPSSVIIHEFAHKLDMADGYVDGDPPLSPGATRAFEEAVTTSMTSLSHASDFDPLSEYALTNRAEFFSCATESFFLRSRSLHERFPPLYAILSELYQQDPLSAR
jgi:Mlc titration factor MtfA (ptsG expression regulator)